MTITKQRKINNALNRIEMTPMKNISLIVLFLLSFWSPNILKAQEGLPIYSDYLTDNYYLIHPSMAGAANCAQVRLTARQNWFGQKDAPGLQTLSINSSLGNSNSAIGGIAFADNNGYHSQSGAYVTYAHHLKFSRSDLDLNMLSFGLSAGLLQYRLDRSEFVAGNDPLAAGGNLSSGEFNIDFGFSYHLYDFYAHVTAKNLLKNSGINNDLQITSNLRRYLISTGFIISKPGKTLSYEPSLLIQHQEGTKQSTIDFNIKLYQKLKSNTLYGGISYRRSLDGAEFLEGNEIVSQKLNYFTPFIGLNYKKFTFAYTYSHQLNSLVFDNGGLHQITLGFDFSCKKERYDCNCPAIN